MDNPSFMGDEKRSPGGVTYVLLIMTYADNLSLYSIALYSPLLFEYDYLKSCEEKANILPR